MRGFALALSTDQRHDLETRLEGLGALAIEQLEWVMKNSDRPEALIKAAESVLDRIGFAKHTQQDITVEGEAGIVVEHRFPDPDPEAITIERPPHEVLPERDGG